MEGVKFVKLRSLWLGNNRIMHLHPDLLITPRLRVLTLAGNTILSLTDVTQHAWGSSLPTYDYLSISLRLNPWNWNGSLAWMQGRLIKLGNDIIYARPPFKPFVRFVEKECFATAPMHVVVLPLCLLLSFKMFLHLFLPWMAWQVIGYITFTKYTYGKISQIKYCW